VKRILTLEKKLNRFFAWLILLFSFTAWTGFCWMLAAVPIIFDAFVTGFIKKYYERLAFPVYIKRSAELVITLFITVLAAFLLKSLIADVFSIPSSSMEKTLNTGDYIIVSKIAYGPRLPLRFRLRELFIPDYNVRHRPAFNYRRLKGFGKIKNGDVVVFNFPEGDSIYTDAAITEKNGINFYKTDTALSRNRNTVFRQVDMRENYIKRCLAIPGDIIMASGGSAVINGIPEKDIPGLQFNYYIITSGKNIDSLLISGYNVSPYEITLNSYNSVYEVPLTENSYESLRDNPVIKGIRKRESRKLTTPDLRIFPNEGSYSWTEDNFGPLIVPAKGMTVMVNPFNIALYSRIISVYEKNDLDIRQDGIYINGIKTDTYTFCMDYYFMVGDNRHNSNDSRFWGFVPEDHIIGKAWLVWWSVENRGKDSKTIRWRNMFKKIR
jgi:signal peptidase I